MSRTIAPTDTWWKEEGREETLKRLFTIEGKSDAEIARSMDLTTNSVANKRAVINLRRKSASPPGRYRPALA